MKRLLFVVGCLLLLLAAAAAPASAADRIQWQVIVNFHSLSDPPIIIQVNYTDMTFTDVDAKGRYFTAVPATATDVVVGTATPFVNSGNAAVFASSFFQRMTVVDPARAQIIDVDESTGQQYWIGPYPYNDFSSYYGPFLPYNPRIGGGMMWEVDWMVPLPRPAGSATLKRGTYSITYSCMLTHVCADPMFPGRVPGGEGYPPIGGPWGWTEPSTPTFRVQ